MRLYEEARERLVERLIAAGSAQALEQIGSLEELRLLASFLWLPRESAPLRRLGLRIQPASAGMARRAMLQGPGFEVELDNYRFSATTATRQAAAEQRRMQTAAQQALRPTPAPVSDGAERVDAPLRSAVAAQAEIAPAAATHPLEDMEGLEPDSAYATRELESIAPAEVRPTRPLVEPPTAPPERGPSTGPRRLWPLPGLLGRRGGDRRARD